MILREAHAADGVKLSTYSYVSLFGLEDLDRLKASIFENAIAVESMSVEPRIESLGATLKYLSKAAAAWIPGLAGHPVFPDVNRFIICIDDIERKGKKLKIIDIFGIASLFKEERQCKIALIVSDHELEEEDQKALDLASKTVIDTSLLFEPTPQESTEIVLKGHAAQERLLNDYCCTLNIFAF